MPIEDQSDVMNTKQISGRCADEEQVNNGADALKWNGTKTEYQSDLRLKFEGKKTSKMADFAVHKCLTSAFDCDR
jgi:hypothetical protein